MKLVSKDTGIAAAPPRGWTLPLRRLGWGVVDQGVSSVSNLALGLFVARSFGADDFGAFALAFVTYTVVINAARGLATDPLMVRFSGGADDRWRAATSAAAGTALTVGVMTGALCVVAGLLLPQPVGPVFVVLGLGLPGLTVQDSWRFAFFAAGRGSCSFLNDLAWTVALILTLVVMHVRGEGSAVQSLIAFGATATLAAVLGACQARTVPRWRLARSWLVAHSSLSYRYLVENVSISGASQVRAFVLGGVAGLAAVGQVRASEMLLGPFFVLLMGVSQVAVPEASRVLQHDPRRLRRFCFVLGGSQAAGACLWGAMLLTVFPLGPGDLLLKDLWQPTAQLVPAITLTVAGASFVTAFTAGLRAMGDARRSLRAQLYGSTFYLTGGIAGAVMGGAVGTSWGVALAVSLSALVWWRSLDAALTEASSQPVDR